VLLNQTHLRRYIYYIPLTILLSFFTGMSLHAQYKVKGKVYDSTRSYPMQYVTVHSTSGKLSISDGKGMYEISVGEKDSIWFSYLGKPTPKYPVLSMTTPLQFDIALNLGTNVLKEVFVKTRDYRQDSIQNRLDYAKAFDWYKPKISPVTPTGPGVAAGFDLDQLIRMFQFRKNRSAAAFQQRLLEQEREKFVEHRYNKALVLRLTGLSGAARDSFMLRCRPVYEFCIMATDYEFQSYIKDCYQDYKNKKASGKLKLQDD